MKSFLVGTLLVGIACIANVRCETDDIFVPQEDPDSEIIGDEVAIKLPDKYQLSGSNVNLNAGLRAPAPVVIRDPSEVPELHRCHYGDLVCIQKQITIGLRTLYAGVPRLNLLPFDPLSTHKTLKITQTKESLVNLDFTFIDNEILGFREQECIHVRYGDWMNRLHDLFH